MKGRTRHAAVLVPTQNGSRAALIGGLSNVACSNSEACPSGYTCSSLGMCESGGTALLAPLATGEVFVPSSRVFVDAGFSLPTPLAEACAVLTGGSQPSILVTAGVTSSGTSLVPNQKGYFLDLSATTGAYSSRTGVSDTINTHVSPICGALGSGSAVVLAGGFQAQSSTSFTAAATPVTANDFFNGVTAAFSAATPMSDARGYGSGLVLPNGAMLISGGLNTATTASQKADYMTLGSASPPSLERTSPVGQPRQGRYLHQLTLLPDGSVLVSGGLGFGTNATLQMVTRLEVPSRRTSRPRTILTAGRNSSNRRGSRLNSASWRNQGVGREQRIRPCPECPTPVPSPGGADRERGT